MKTLQKVPLELVEVEFIPPHNEMEFGKLYYSKEYKTTNHLCPCGSGIGDARNLETLNYKQAVLRVLPIPC